MVGGTAGKEEAVSPSSPLVRLFEVRLVEQCRLVELLLLLH